MSNRLPKQGGRSKVTVDLDTTRIHKWHPQPAEFVRVLGARDDYAEVYNSLAAKRKLSFLMGFLHNFAQTAVKTHRLQANDNQMKA